MNVASLTLDEYFLECLQLRTVSKQRPSTSCKYPKFGATRAR